MIKWLAVFSIVFASSNAFAQLSFERLTPESGVPGDTAELFATGLDPNTTYTVSINGVAATGVQVTANSLRFTVGGGTQSGEVSVAVAGGAPLPTQFNFIVERQLSGQLVVPAGMLLSGYEVASFAGISTVATNGNFTVRVPENQAFVLTALRNANDPFFYAVVTSTNSSVTIDAQSTAIALAFLNPVLTTRVDTKAREVVNLLANSSVVNSLADAITSAAADGRSYFQDARVDAALEAVVTEIFAPPLPRPASLRVPSVAQGLNPDWIVPPPSTPVLLDTTISNRADIAPDGYFIEVTQTNMNFANDNDWLIEIFELDPAQFPNGRSDLAGLTPDSLPTFLNNRPVKAGYLHASLSQAKNDVVERSSTWLVELFTSKATSLDQRFSPSSFLLPLDRSGVFISQAYSGNAYRGTTFFEGNRNQANIIANADPNQKWIQAMGINITIAMLDFIAAAVPNTKFEPEERISFMQTVLVDLNKALQAQAQTNTGLTKEKIFDIIKTTMIAALKTVFDLDSIKKFFTQRVDKLIIGLGDAIFKNLDFIGRLSALGQSFERGVFGVVLPGSLAVERTVFVLGNPFEPKITSFRPQRGREGARLHLSGFHFPERTDDVVVKFFTLPGSVPPDANPDTIAPAAELTVPVLHATKNSLLVNIPTNWVEVLGNRPAYISVSDTNNNRTTTVDLNPPHTIFHFIDKPTLTNVTPNPVVRGGLIVLSGTNFDGEGRLNNEVILDGNRNLEVVNASETNVVARLPALLTAGSHTVKVKLGNRETTEISFASTDPRGASSGFMGGVQITINQLDFSNNSGDGKVSFLEAFLIANNGRLVGQHDPREFLAADHPDKIPFAPAETDFVSGDDDTGAGGGPNARDTIRVDSSLAGNVIILTQAMPAPTQGDTLDMNGLIIDGSQLGGAPNALTFNGTQGIDIKNVTFRGFAGYGARFLNGAAGNVLESVRFENCGISGVFLDGDVRNNTFEGLFVSGSGKHGLHLSGANVRYNTLELPAVSVTNRLGLIELSAEYGVLIENGATFNVVHPGTVTSNALTGILVRGSNTTHNVIGRNSNVVPRLNDITSNGGHGVHLMDGVQHTVLRYLAPAGNQGDGILLDGPDCAFNQLDGIFTGIDYYAGNQQPRLPNTGNGIHLRNGAHHNLLGSRTPGGFGERGAIVGNLGAGILLEGTNTSFNTINRMNIGDFQTFISPFRPPFETNGTHGIHLRNGASSNVLGATHSFLDLHISTQPVGAGVMLEGPGTDHNLILGNQIGTDHGFSTPEMELEVGIHIKDGPIGNVIGRPGQFIQLQPSFDPFRPFNVIVNCTRAGVVIENAASNIVQNNFVGETEFAVTDVNEVGVLLTGGAHRNLISGARQGEGNLIARNTRAGIKFENNSITNLGLANLIRNNVIRHTGSEAGAITDPLASTPPGCGILFSGASRNNLGGLSITTPNILTNNIVGAYFENTAGNELVGNFIRSNTLAGVILRDSTNNHVGGSVADQQNQILGNGNGATEQGGILIAGGEGNHVIGNAIGTRGNADFSGNRGAGIYLKNSSANEIGGTTLPGGNVIGRNTSHGLHITGAGSTANRVRHNFIGTDAANANLANLGSGVFLDGGASQNVIGGKDFLTIGPARILFAMENRIAFNQLSGVEVSGGTTVGNSILDNGIYANGMSGIRLSAGGNNNQLPPIQAVYDGTTMSGTVPSVAQVPVGSIVQIFCDLDPLEPEGQVKLGEATVLTGGQWSTVISPPVFPIFSLTATAPDGSTSPFGTDAQLNLGLAITRADGQSPGARNVNLSGGSAGVFHLQIASLNGDVEMSSIRFTASGSLNEATEISAAKIYRDADADGMLTAADALLSGPVRFTNDNGGINFDLTGVSLRANQAERWMLVYESTNAASGANFSVSIQSAADVVASYVLPVDQPAMVSTSLPVNSDNLTVTAASGMTAWLSQFFNAAELNDPNISGLSADPDGDRIPNLVEYALGLNPRVVDQNAIPHPRAEGGRLIFEYTRRRNAADLVFSLKASTELPALIDATGLFEQQSATDNGNGTETVRLRSVEAMSARTKLYLVVRVNESQ